MRRRLETERPAFGKSVRVSEFQFPNPDRVRPAPFNMFRWDILDHRGSIARRDTHPTTDSQPPQKTKSFSTWMTTWDGPSLHDVRVFALIAGPLVMGYLAVVLLGRAAHWAAVWLLPRYFGEGPRVGSELFIRIALSIGIYLFLAVIAWIAMHACYHRLLIPELARAKLRRGKCASCSYPVADLQPATDGCTVCPECGAAWKLNAPITS